MKRSLFGLQGVTLVELMMVVALFTGIVGTMFFLLIHSDTYWTKGQAKIAYQAKARIAIHEVSRHLRQSKAGWVRISNTDLGNTSDYTLFYCPVFDDDGNYTGTNWVVYRFDPVNNLLTRRQQGDVAYETVIDHVANAQFFGSQDCVTFASTTVNASCPRVRFALSVQKEDEVDQSQEFNATTDIELRNEFSTTTAAPEWPEEGEF